MIGKAANAITKSYHFCNVPKAFSVEEKKKNDPLEDALREQ